MKYQIKERLFSFLLTSNFSFIIVSIVFFFAWSDLMIDNGHRFPDWGLIIGGLIIPIMLLIGAVRYNNRVSYGVTLSIFVFAILTNLSSLPYYIEEYNYEKNSGMSNCSCCPECEIKSILYLIFVCCFAIVLMNRKKLLKVFNWKLSHSVKLIAFTLLIYLVISMI